MARKVPMSFTLEPAQGAAIRELAERSTLSLAALGRLAIDYMIRHPEEFLPLSLSESMVDTASREEETEKVAVA